MNTPAFELERPDITRWRGGNTGTPGVWHFDSGQPGRHVLLSSLVHGNEVCGAWAVAGLLERQLRPASGKLTLVFANLDAFDRFDPAAHEASRFVDEDLNRQWMDERMADGGTLERRRAAELAPWVRQADWLLDLHSMSAPSPPLMLAGMQARHLELARRLRSPEHVVVDAGHRDGVRMRDYGRFGLPDALAPEARALLVECGYHGDPASRGVAQDACVRFLQASGTVPAQALDDALVTWRRPDAGRQWVLEVSGAVTARSRDFRFTRDFQGLECIAEAGTVIGFNEGEDVTTPHDDCVLVMPSARQARAGVTVVRFAHRRPLA